MDVVPVIDLREGDVVRGVAGRRAEYRPIASALCAGSVPAEVAAAFVERFGFDSVYVADLDAITGRPPAVDAYAQIAAAGLTPWIDAGVRDAAGAKELLAAVDQIDANASLIVGLESIASRDALRQIAAALPRQRLIFSLDLKQGEPLAAADWQGVSAESIADEAISLGFARLIVLDLAQVGTGRGPAVATLCAKIRQRYPCVELIAGGGVRRGDDLRTLAESGCDLALVASALHDGSLTRADLVPFRRMIDATRPPATRRGLTAAHDALPRLN
ncbi:MAG: hisA/hisF family protein [Planctomycetes bacterium]|nr:hisA/hisF family protein [Planctomycetota bacterium]